jgi:hypothetical protein
MGVGGDDTPTVRDDARKIVRSTATWPPSDNGIEVRPGDPSRAAEVEGWLRDYATGRDPHLRERIVLAYLGLADRLAARYRAGHGTTLEDLTQTARAGLIAAVDRYDPSHRGGFVPFRSPPWSESQAVPARHQLEGLHPPAAQGPDAAAAPGDR